MLSNQPDVVLPVTSRDFESTGEAVTDDRLVLVLLPLNWSTVILRHARGCAEDMVVGVSSCGRNRLDLVPTGVVVEVLSNRVGSGLPA